MSTTLRIPKAAVSMQEGVLTSWLVADGAVVAEGQPIYTLELEKSTMDVESPAAGVLKRTGVAGETYKVGTVIGEIVDSASARPAPEPGAIPAGGVYHTGWVVPNLQAAVRHWVEFAGAGPFVLFEDFAFVAPVYRGQPGGPRVTLAFGMSGESCIELIQPLDSGPSIYTESSGALHHVGILTDSLDAGIAAYAAAGVTCAFRAAFPFGSGCAYLDTTSTLGIYTELVERSPVIDGMLAQMRAAHRDWNRRDHTFVLS